MSLSILIFVTISASPGLGTVAPTTHDQGRQLQQLNGFCGYPHLRHPLELPWQYCSLTTDKATCESTPYFAQFPCEWNESAKDCASAAFRAGLDSDNCTWLTDQDSCVRSGHIGFPNCKWIEIPPTPAPTPFPTSAPTTAHPTRRPTPEPTPFHAAPVTRSQTPLPTRFAATNGPTPAPTPWQSPSPTLAAVAPTGYCGFPDDRYAGIKPYNLCSIAATKEECDNDLYFMDAECEWYNHACHNPPGFVGTHYFCPNQLTLRACKSVVYPGVRPCLWYDLTPTSEPTWSPTPLPPASPTPFPTTLSRATLAPAPTPTEAVIVEEAGSAPPTAISPDAPVVAPTPPPTWLAHMEEEGMDDEMTSPHDTPSSPTSSPSSEPTSVFEKDRIATTDTFVGYDEDPPKTNPLKKNNFAVYMGGGLLAAVVAAVVYQVWPWNGCFGSKNKSQQESSSNEEQAAVPQPVAVVEATALQAVPTGSDGLPTQQADLDSDFVDVALDYL